MIDLESIPTRTKLIAFGAWFLALMITLSIYIGGVGDQLTFGSQICLLYIENYHQIDGKGPWLFDTYSPSCSANISAGSIGLALLFAVALFRGYFFYRNEEPSRRVILVLMCVTAFWAAVSLVFAFIMSSGLRQTCRQFERSGKSCGAVFGEGFFVNNISKVYRKNINTINAAVGAAWASVGFWLLYAGFEFYSYRNSSLKWW